MPKNASIDVAIRRIVTEQVGAAMEPYQLLFDRLSALFGKASSGRGPGRPRKTGAPGRRAARAGAKDAASAAHAFSVGQAVSYKQGRGTFDAKVLEIDEPTGLMTLQRLGDGKKVVRPASKVGASPVGGAEPKPANARKTAKAGKAAKAPKAAKAGRRGKAKAGKAAKIDFAEGQRVVYRQGRGSFDAKVVGIDHDAGTLRLQREKDGKEVTRPAAKVRAAA